MKSSKDNKDKFLEYFRRYVTLEFHLTDHCNMNCKWCAHYSSISDKRFATMDEVEGAVNLAKIIKPKQFHILGGEPLLHPKVDEILDLIGNNIPEGTTVYFVTNGILLKKMSNEFWNRFKEYAIKLYITIYPMKFDYNELILYAKDRGVILSGLDNPRLFFRSVRLAEDRRYDPKNAFNSCRAKCMQIRDGKLFPCTYSAYVETVNKQFGTSFTHQENDYLITDEITEAEIVARWMEEPKPFCAYCNSGSEPRVRWKQSSVHDIDEWVEI